MSVAVSIQLLIRWSLGRFIKNTRISPRHWRFRGVLLRRDPGCNFGLKRGKFRIAHVA